MGIKEFAPPSVDGTPVKPKSKAQRPAKAAPQPAGPALRWDDGLSLGVAEIDAQHQALLGHCNELVEAVRQGRGGEAVARLVNRLRDYTVAHFAAEEAYMERVGYPHLDRHRAAHAALTRQVKDYQRRLYLQQVPDPAEVRAFLKDWLVAHILGEDLKIGAHARSSASAAPAPAAPESGPDAG